MITRLGRLSSSNWWLPPDPRDSSPGCTKRCGWVSWKLWTHWKSFCVPWMDVIKQVRLQTQSCLSESDIDVSQTVSLSPLLIPFCFWNRKSGHLNITSQNSTACSLRHPACMTWTELMCFLYEHQRFFVRKGGHISVFFDGWWCSSALSNSGLPQKPLWSLVPVFLSETMAVDLNLVSRHVQMSLQFHLKCPQDTTHLTLGEDDPLQLACKPIL